MTRPRTMARRARVALGAVVLGAAVLGATACGGGDDPGPASVEVGTGFAAFEPLADGDPIDVIQGPQGGFHVLGSVRASGLEPGDADDLASPDNPTTTFRVVRAGVRVDLDAARYTQGLQPVDDHHVMLGRLVILDIAADDELAGAEIELEVEVVDVDGARASDRRRLIARPHPLNP